MADTCFTAPFDASCCETIPLRATGAMRTTLTAPFVQPPLGGSVVVPADYLLDFSIVDDRGLRMTATWHRDTDAERTLTYELVAVLRAQHDAATVDAEVARALKAAGVESLDGADAELVRQQVEDAATAWEGGWVTLRNVDATPAAAALVGTLLDAKADLVMDDGIVAFPLALLPFLKVPWDTYTNTAVEVYDNASGETRRTWPHGAINVDRTGVETLCRVIDYLVHWKDVLQKLRDDEESGGGGSSSGSKKGAAAAPPPPSTKVPLQSDSTEPWNAAFMAWTPRWLLHLYGDDADAIPQHLKTRGQFDVFLSANALDVESLLILAAHTQAMALKGKTQDEICAQNGCPPLTDADRAQVARLHPWTDEKLIAENKAKREAEEAAAKAKVAAEKAAADNDAAVAAAATDGVVEGAAAAAAPADVGYDYAAAGEDDDDADGEGEGGAAGYDADEAVGYD